MQVNRVCIILHKVPSNQNSMQPDAQHALWCGTKKHLETHFMGAFLAPIMRHSFIHSFIPTMTVNSCEQTHPASRRQNNETETNPVKRFLKRICVCTNPSSSHPCLSRLSPSPEPSPDTYMLGTSKQRVCIGIKDLVLWLFLTDVCAKYLCGVDFKYHVCCC